MEFLLEKMEDTGIKNAKIEEKTGEGFGGVINDKDL